MNPLCPLCKAPVLVARGAVGGEDVVLQPARLTFIGEHAVAVVGGFAWRPGRVCDAIANELATTRSRAVEIAMRLLDWHLPHVCAAGSTA
ncbi:hypothetical protein ASD11_01375 [Aeromicrobium sp. Root495]|nr:hypothetical protein ASD11_01375 [Aeromicrobium sp. Root495]